MDMPLVGKDLFQPLFRGYYRGLNNYTILGVPYYDNSTPLVGKELFQPLLRGVWDSVRGRCWLRSPGLPN